jgi:hypothetical protein
MISNYVLKFIGCSFYYINLVYWNKNNIYYKITEYTQY